MDAVHLNYAVFENEDNRKQYSGCKPEVVLSCRHVLFVIIIQFELHENGMR